MNTDPTSRPPLPQRTREAGDRSPDPRLVRTSADREAEALQDEFPDFQIWIDFRPMEDGHLHWHARQPDWTPDMNLNARDCQSMRDELIIWTRENSGAQHTDAPGTL